MELIRGLHNLRPRHRGSVVTIGAFDGVHRGHRAVLGHLLEKAAEAGLPSVVVVFEPLPREYLAPLQAPARLMNFREKFRELEQLGVDRVLRVRFDAALRNMAADEFIRRVFVEGLGVKCVVVGDDLRFGRGREGDFDLVTEQGERHGYLAVPTSTFGLGGARVSSTRVREALEAADFALAEQLLGRPYSMTGKVVRGAGRGRQLGTPTANLDLRRLRSPLSGVYVVEVRGAGEDDRPLPGVANIGTRPTVEEGLEANLEVHILDADRDLYGSRLTVVFREKIREEMKFPSLDALRQQVEQDKAHGRRFFGQSGDNFSG